MLLNLCEILNIRIELKGAMTSFGFITNAIAHSIQNRLLYLFLKCYG